MKEWRKNIHDMLKFSNKGWETGIPMVIEDAIDSAYLQGLEDGREQIRKGEL